MAVAKVTINGTTILDLTDATADASTIVSPKTAYIADGSKAVGQASGGGGSPTLETITKSYTPTESQQTETITPGSGYDGIGEVDVTVGAISSTYVGSGITRRDSTDLMASGAMVTVPAGFYESTAGKGVATATQATPSVSIAADGLITATSTQAEGYVTGGTKTGTLQLTARDSTDLTANAETVTAPAGYYPSAVSKSVNVATQATPVVSIDGNALVTATATQSSGYVYGGTKTGQLQLTKRTSADLTASGATVSAPAGYYPSAVYKDVSAGSATTPSTAITPSLSISIDADALITATASGSKSITPAVVAGYVSAGTAGTVTVSKTGTLQLTKRTSADLTASGTTVTAPAGYYPEAATKTVTVASGSATTPTTTIVANPTITIDPATAEITATVSTGESITPTVVAGYVSAGTAGTVSVTGSATEQMTKRTSADLTASGRTVTAPAGFYPSAAYKDVDLGSATTPSTAITPSMSVSIDADGLISATASGSKSITPAVVAGYVSAGTAGNVTVSGSGSLQLTKRTSSDLTASGLTVTAPKGYYPAAATFTLTGALECETGTYTPGNNIAKPTISFANSHTNPPAIIVMTDTSSASGITANSNTAFMLIDFERLNGAGYPYSTSATRYALAAYIYRTSNGSTLGSTQIQYGSDDTGSGSTGYYRYWATASAFYPYSNSSSRYWRSGRTYKWIAIWK